MTVVLAWEPPPETRRGGWGHWQRVARELAERPGVWGLVVEDDTPRYAHESAKRQLRKYGCEVQVRQVAKRASVWARWPV